MEQLSIQEKIGANYVLLELTGAINSYTFSEMQSKVYQYIQDSNLVLDMDLVTSIDSSGLGVLMGAHNDEEIFGTKLYLMRPSNAVINAIQSTGFLDEFRRIYSVTEVEA
jgi:anti-anti-sigma factor